jgi:hypothetical protein
MNALLACGFFAFGGMSLKNFVIPSIEVLDVLVGTGQKGAGHR